MKKIEVLGLQTIPQIKQGDNLAQIIVTAGDREIGGLQDKDVLVLTSKIVSKAAGRLRKFDEVMPGKKALSLSKRIGKDAKWLQMILDEGHRILAVIPLKGVIERHVLRTSGDAAAAKELIEHEAAICITQGKDGRIYTCDAGIDSSNHPEGIVSLLPENPDRQAKEIREQVRKLTGKQVAVILGDTEMMPFGTMDFALGSSGIAPISRMFAQKDLYGRTKFGGMDLTAHELTVASALIFGQTAAGIPVAVIRGCQYEINETENIASTMLPQTNNADAATVLKAALRASACVHGLKIRLLLKVASWFL
jgi:coenzyme F420-0:L-glutamate ligase / coenzyme F420-1:gamma-L-glutamate ligase